MEKQAPSWLQELLDQEEIREEKQKLEMSKIMADRALAAIAVIESKINEVNEIAEKEINLIQQWNLSEVEKLQKKIDWLVWNLENYMKGTGEKTISLPHGKIQFRMGRDKFTVIDEQKFMVTAQKLGLVRISPAKIEADLLAIANYTKLNGGRPPVGVMLTPAQSKFTYKTKGSNDGNTEWNDEQTEAGSASRQTDQAHAA